MYNFNLRKDTSIRNSQNIQRALTMRSVISLYGISLARGYINNLVSADVQIKTDLEEKVDVPALMTVLSSGNYTAPTGQSITDAVTQAIATINAERQNAIDAISALNTVVDINIITNAINSSLAIALGKINTDKNTAVSEINTERIKAVSEINQLALDVSNEINNLNTGVKAELLRKIDYLFEMFYHSKSDALMELFPLAQL